ncbi:MAG: methylmalonyl-CoA mutase family protein [Caulobacteraceae bacterium]
MTFSPTPLADGFAPAMRANWLALVEKTLKGAGVETLTTRGTDGLAIAPLYEPSLEPEPFIPAPRGGERPWDIRARVRQPGLTLARDAVAEDLAGGAASIILAIRQTGAEGIAVTCRDDMARVVEEVLIDVAPVALDAGFLGPEAAEWLSGAAKASPAAPLAFHFDPLGAFARSGASPGPIENHLISAANTAARMAPIYPAASFFLASGAVAHEAGGGPAEELAFALASALAYLKAMVRAGLSIEAAGAGVVLGLAVDTDPLISISKLRAARMLWARMAGVCGAPAPARIEARSSLRMLTTSDPWTNMVRLTAACLAGAVGGDDAMVLGAFTDALGLPTAFARRMARNTQLILMDEGHVGTTGDPVAGAGAFEALTRDLARATWARFNAIEAAGGVVAALREGLIAREVQASRKELAAAIAAGEMKIVGVTDFRALDAKPVAVEEAPADLPRAPEARLPGPDSACPALNAISLEDLTS